MPDVGFAGHEGHRDTVAQLALAQIRVEDHREFVSRPEAARTAGRTYDNGARLQEELLVAFPSGGGMRVRANRLRKTVRSEARNLVERELRPRCDHEVVVIEHGSVADGELRMLGIDCRGGLRDPVDAVLRQRPRQLHAGLLARPPTYRDPRVRRRKFEVRARAHQRDSMLLREMLAQLVSARYAADACSQNDDVRHDWLLIGRLRPAAYSLRRGSG